MTAPTHGIFAIVIIFLFGVTKSNFMVYIIFGSLLPDIDHPQSTIGRILFFISHPLNKRFGHRTLTHSLVLWIPVMWLGFLYCKPLFYVGVGAFSHLVLDSWNLSGVGLFRPITDKIFVMASKNYRIRVSSKQELILMVCLIFVAWGSFYLADLGGLRGMVREVIADYSIAVKEYKNHGTKVCYLEGKLRYTNGRIEKGRWLIIGQGSWYNALDIYDEDKEEIINITDDGEFLRAHVRPTDRQWNTLRLNEPMEVKEGEVFYKVSREWHKASVGDVVLGSIIYQGAAELGSASVN